MCHHLGDGDARYECRRGRRTYNDISTGGSRNGLNELFNVEDCGASLLAKALGIDAATHGDGGEQLCILSHIVGESAVKRLLAENLVLVVHLEDCTSLDSLDNGAEWLEVAHALEVVQSLERKGLVLGTAGLLEQVLVDRQVGLGKVELYLATDLGLVAALVLAVKVGAHAVLLVIIIAATVSKPSTTTSTTPSITTSTASTTSAIATTITTAATIIVAAAVSLVSAIITLGIVLIMHLLCLATIAYLFIPAITLLGAIDLRLAVSDRRGVCLSSGFGHVVRCW